MGENILGPQRANCALAAQRVTVPLLEGAAAHIDGATIDLSISNENASNMNLPWAVHPQPPRCGMRT